MKWKNAEFSSLQVDKLVERHWPDGRERTMRGRQQGIWKGSQLDAHVEIVI